MGERCLRGRRSSKSLRIRNPGKRQILWEFVDFLHSSIEQVEFLTQALIAMLEGNWVGAPPSAEASLYALNPWLQGTLELDPPVVP